MSIISRFINDIYTAFDISIYTLIFDANIILPPRSSISFHLLVYPGPRHLFLWWSIVRSNICRFMTIVFSVRPTIAIISAVVRNICGIIVVGSMAGIPRHPRVVRKPRNRLISYGNRFRVSASFLRKGAPTIFELI